MAVMVVLQRAENPASPLPLLMPLLGHGVQRNAGNWQAGDYDRALAARIYLQGPAELPRSLAHSPDSDSGCAS